MYFIFFFFFFFSSRRRHTRWTGDWSSDVCSSDLARRAHVDPARQRVVVLHALRLDEHEAGHRLAAGAAGFVHMRLAARGLPLPPFDAHHQLRLAHHPPPPVAPRHPSHPPPNLSLPPHPARRPHPP